MWLWQMMEHEYQESYVERVVIDWQALETAVSQLDVGESGESGESPMAMMRCT